MASSPEIQAVGGPALERRGPAGRVRLRRLLGRLTPWLLLAPAFALLAWLLAYPLGDAVHLSFTNWDGFSAPKSVGLDNFTELAHDKHFKEALLHNLIIVASLPIWIAIPYFVAWGLHTKVWGWRFFRFAFFLPAVFSPVVIGVYYGMVLKPDGPLNGLLRAIGLGGLAHQWLNEPGLTLGVVIAIIIWSTFGVGVLIFLSALSNLDQELVEAAHVDGASRWQIQRHVVFWQLLPVIEFWAIIIVIASFTAFFPLIYTLTQGGPGFSTYTADYDLYQEAFAGGNLGYASAIGVVLLVVIGLVAGLTVGLLRRRRRLA
jgi:ABC-type sugar transport system permease subunit